VWQVVKWLCSLLVAIITRVICLLVYSANLIVILLAYLVIAHSQEQHRCSTSAVNMNDGAFIAVKRGTGWEECMLCCPMANAEWIVYTQDNENTFHYSYVKLVLGQYKMIQGRDAARTAPPGMVDTDINWLCAPPHYDRAWAPTQLQLGQIIGEGHQIAELVKVEDITPVVAGHAKAGLPDVQDPNNHADDGPMPKRGRAPGTDAKGVDGQPGSSGDKDLKELSKAIEALQLDVLKGDRSSSRKKKDKKKSKSKRSRSDSSSRGRSSRRRRKSRKSRSKSSSSSRSRSHSRSSSRRKKFLMWKHKGRDRSVSPRTLAAIETEKMKSRAALLIFAQRFPGALTAHFINAMRLKLHGSAGLIRRTKDLRKIDVTRWVMEASELSEIRDRREALTLATIMNYINQSQYSHAMDIASTRLQAIQKSKQKGSSWEKASKGELLPLADADLSIPGISGLIS